MVCSFSPAMMPLSSISLFGLLILASSIAGSDAHGPPNQKTAQQQYHITKPNKTHDGQSYVVQPKVVPRGPCGPSSKCTGIGQTCCSGKCVKLVSDRNHCGKCGSKCPQGKICKSSHCALPLVRTVSDKDKQCLAAGKDKWCGNCCVKTSTDALHCGACFKSCGPLQSCCSGNCTDTMTDINNCGQCGHACSPVEQCLHGVCNYGYGSYIPNKH